MKNSIQLIILFVLVMMKLAIIGCAGSRGVSTLVYDASLEAEWDIYPIQSEVVSVVSPDYPLIWDSPRDVRIGYWTRKTFSQESETSVGGIPQVVMFGYRVQIFSGVDFYSAQSVQNDASEMFEMPIYIECEPPQYKVRIGDFRSREEADDFCRSIRREGFRDAWVIRSQINR